MLNIFLKFLENKSSKTSAFVFFQLTILEFSPFLAMVILFSKKCLTTLQWKNNAILSKTVTGVKNVQSVLGVQRVNYFCVPCNFSDLTGFIRLTGLSAVRITLSDVTETCFYYMPHSGANYFLFCLR